MRPRQPKPLDWHRTRQLCPTHRRWSKTPTAEATIDTGLLSPCSAPIFRPPSPQEQRRREQWGHKAREQGGSGGSDDEEAAGAGFGGASLFGSSGSGSGGGGHGGRAVSGDSGASLDSTASAALTRHWPERLQMACECAEAVAFLHLQVRLR